MQKIYVARLEGGSGIWKGMCKQYVYEGKNILSFRFICRDKGILEILAEQKELSEEIVGVYECVNSIRQFGTEKCDDDIEREWKEKIEISEEDHILSSFVHIEGITFFMEIDTSEDFSDFCKN